LKQPPLRKLPGERSTEPGASSRAFREDALVREYPCALARSGHKARRLSVPGNSQLQSRSTIGRRLLTVLNQLSVLAHPWIRPEGRDNVFYAELRANISDSHFERAIFYSRRRTTKSKSRTTMIALPPCKSCSVSGRQCPDATCSIDLERIAPRLGIAT
jgi:hypothetical protein